MAKLSSSTLLIGAAAVVAIGLVGFVVSRGSGPGPHDALAQCLTEKGVVMYGAWWCPHCTKQKTLFGTSFSKVNYVECSPGGTKAMSQQCKDDGIEGYPTWVFPDASRLSGEQTLETLALKAGCESPTPSAE
ncbi:hypothetical protein A2856_02440 [Candidatus Uhrbacteria bacterium RIFCSPHIGHO2_01_FULL_63_20]|uniref:Thioredoxin domain-containing protein n=1 Tax=Candidatus Uhrbacteria bacterium RIFCSPHIGHO2_01_FULL_63_20 TaxID=1802385 RepID=A0A1F7TLW1_9BACT|nr:MAG: hypothetical protein A2856_02440 [Candidatus Uhrbacteria bacterium RIFCSPHIGHO2_01_FULL_63_20]